MRQALHARLQQLLEPTQGVLQRESKFLCVRLFAAVEGSDGKVDVVGLRVVANGVAIRNEGAETHHAVRVGRNLMKQNATSAILKQQLVSMTPESVTSSQAIPPRSAPKGPDADPAVICDHKNTH